MAEIGLIDVDGHNYPNVALMKLSAWHKRNGDTVEWVVPRHYDRIYKSKVFSWTDDRGTRLAEATEVIQGGTGYGFDTLPPHVDQACPDYSIYPEHKEAYGFLTRGCPRSCSWCIVPQKEGQGGKYMDIEEFWDGRKATVLMDNNVLAYEWGLEQIEKIIRLGIRVDFNQGLDAGLITEEIAKLLGRVEWYKPLRMACDTMAQMKHIKRATELLRTHGAKPQRYFVYVLTKDVPDAMQRVLFLRSLNLDPFAQPYRDATGRVNYEVRRFARWVNHKATLKTVRWEEYKG